METILNYLDTMFQNMPDTEQVRKAKEELAAMMEDKYRELLAEGKNDNEAVGIVISEFGNLEELSSQLGLDGVEYSKEADETKNVSDTEARDYIHAVSGMAHKIAIGVFLCICSPIVLIILSGLNEKNYISEAVAVCVGLSVMFFMIAIAVCLFIYQGVLMNKYEYMKKVPIKISRGTEMYVKGLKEREGASFAIKISIGVALILCGIIPVCFSSYISDFASIIAVGVMLLFVAIAVVLFIEAGCRRDAFQVLLQEEDYSVSKKKNSKILDAIGGIYWSIATAIYLIWSFVTFDWGFTWIVWPIAGVLYGVIAAVCAIVNKE